MADARKKVPAPHTLKKLEAKNFETGQDTMWQHYHTKISIDEALRLPAEHAVQRPGWLPGYGHNSRTGTRSAARCAYADRCIAQSPPVIKSPARRHDPPGGALVTHNHLVGSDSLCSGRCHFGPGGLGSRRTGSGNRGTVAGNVITASPANDTIVPLWALQASVINSKPCRASEPSHWRSSIKRAELLARRCAPTKC